MNVYDSGENPTRPKAHDGHGSADGNQAVGAAPDNAESHKTRGFAHAANGDYDRAIEEFDQAILLNPGYAEAYLSRGLAYAGKKSYGPAIADFDQAILLNPDYTDAYFNRGVVYIGIKEYGRAMADLETVLQINPRHQDARKLGKMARRQQMKQEAPGAPERPRNVITAANVRKIQPAPPPPKPDIKPIPEDKPLRDAAEPKAGDAVIVAAAEERKIQPAPPPPKPDIKPIPEDKPLRDAAEPKAGDAVIVADAEERKIQPAPPPPKPDIKPIPEDRPLRDAAEPKAGDAVIVADAEERKIQPAPPPPKPDIKPIPEDKPLRDAEKPIERKEEEPRTAAPAKKEPAAPPRRAILWIGAGLGTLLLLGAAAIFAIKSNYKADGTEHASETDFNEPQKSKQEPARAAKAAKDEPFYIPIMGDNGFYKYVTPDGKDITEAKYIRAYIFQEGRALVQRQDSLWGYIDTAGRSFVGSYKQALSFKDGIAWVNDAGSVKALDLSGRITNTLPNDIISVWSFYDGMALFSKNGGQGYINKKFEAIGGGRLFADGNRFQEGAASVMCDNGKYGYIDANGKFITDSIFDVAKTFANSKAIVKTDNGWGLINKRGAYVFGPRGDIEMINTDANTFKYKKDGKWGWLDSDGKVILQPVYEDIMSFDDRDAAPVKQDGKWGYINRNGVYVIDGRYDAAYPFFNNRALVKIGDNFATIDKKGAQIAQIGSQKIDPSYWNYINSGVAGGPRIMSAEPSFKCDASGLSEAEKIICRSVQLANADKAIDSLYKIALNGNKNAAIPQKEFVAERNKCRSVSCVESVYAARSDELNNRATAAQITSFADARDGKVYNVVNIGSQIWMAENLSYNAGGSACYNDENTNCGKYGRLYDWNTARAACPSGWHLPSRREWNNLVASAGASSSAGKKLKATAPNWNGTNEHGFSALPGGYRNDDGSFSAVGTDGSWWTATESGGPNAYLRYMGSDYENVLEMEYDKSNGFSARCVMDAR